MKKTLKIMGQKWSIEIVDNLIDIGECDGTTIKDGKKILLDKSLKGNELKQVLLHEFFHAVWVESGLDQTTISKDLEEIIVEQMSQALLNSFNVSFRK